MRRPPATHCRATARVSKLAAMTTTPAITPRVARIFLHIVVAGAAFMALAWVLALAALFSRQPAFGQAAMIALIVCMLCLATSPGLQAWLLFRSGRWKALNGNLTTRQEQPGRFAVLLAFNPAFAAAWVIGAGYLFWSVVVSRFLV